MAAFEQEMTIRMQRQAVSAYEGEGLGGQRQKQRLLVLEEARKRRFLGRAMHACARDLLYPCQPRPIDMGEIGEFLGGEEISLDIVYSALDLAFMPGSSGAAGGNKEAIMLGHLPVHTREERVFHGGKNDGGF